MEFPQWNLKGIGCVVKPTENYHLTPTLSSTESFSSFLFGSPAPKFAIYSLVSALFSATAVGSLIKPLNAV